MREACRVIRASLSPATAADVAVTVEGLALHFPVLRRTEGESRVVLIHWLEDLRDWPADLIAECARLWRNSGAERFPTPGQFKQPMEAALHHRKALARRAAEFLEIAS